MLIDIDTLQPVEHKAPAFHQDSMSPLWHPTTGKMFDSKSAFRAETKRTGGVELGNDTIASTRKPSYEITAREELTKNYHLQRNGMLPPAEVQTVSAFEKDHGELCLKN